MKKILLFLLFIGAVLAQPNLNYSTAEINTAIGRSLDEFNKTIYYHSEGLSTNTGTNINAPLETLTQAIAKANSLNPTTSYRVAIVSMDVFIDASNYSIPNYVSVFAPFSTYSGTITLGTGASFIDNSDIGGSITINDVTNLSDSLLSKVGFKDSTKYATPYDLTSGLALKVNKADSTGNGYATQYDISLKLNKSDSTIYSTQYDLTSGLLGKVNYSDSTLKYITPKQLSDFNYLQSGDIAGKVNYSDSTTTFFTPYQALGKLNKSDSTLYATQYDLTLKENAFSKNTGFNKNFGNVAGTVKEGFIVKDSSVTSVNKQGSSALKGNVELVGAGTVSLNQTGNTITITGSGGSGTGGEINVGANLGDGTDIYAGKVDTTLTFKSLKASGYLSLSNTDTTITYTTTSALTDTLNTRLNKKDSTLYATQYDLTQISGGGGSTILYRATDFTTSSDTFVDVTDLSFSASANKTYYVSLHCYLFATSGELSRCQISLPSGASGNGVGLFYDAAATAFTQNPRYAFSSLYMGLTSGGIVMFEGFVVVGSTSGDIKVQIRRNNSAGDATIRTPMLKIQEIQ